MLVYAVLILSVKKAVSSPPKLLESKEAERLRLRLYDFPCEETEKHTCACQLRCEDRRRCRKAMDVCLRYKKECRYVVMNPSGEWATLKRLANEVEEAELQGYEEKNWDTNRLAKEQGKLQKEGNKWRAKFARANGFGSSLNNRSKSIAATLRDDKNDLCGKPAAQVGNDLIETATQDWRHDEISISLVALSYKTPATLRRSIRSWLESGLLHVVNERIALLNDPTPADIAICTRHGFDIHTPSSFIQENANGGIYRLNASLFSQDQQDIINQQSQTLLLRTVKRNVFTIGAAFAAASLVAKSQYILFLEKDFATDAAIKQNHVIDELAASIAALKRGIAIVRLRSIKDQGCGTFRRCMNDANMPDWQATTTFDRRRNWWSFYCQKFKKPLAVADCAVGSAALDKTNGIFYRCFTSWDSNWSLNAVIFSRVQALTHKWSFSNNAHTPHNKSPKSRRRQRPSHFDGPGLTLAEYGAATWNKQDGFEVGMLKDDWGRLRMPICLSMRGLFRHVEVDG